MVTPNYKKDRSSWLLALLLVFYLVNGICYLRAQSITSDEASFMDYAIRFLKGHPERIYPVTDNSKMPVSVLNMLPRVAQKAAGTQSKSDWGMSDTMNGRYVTLFISMLTILLVFKWTKEWYGTHAAIFSSFLMVCCPNNLANAGLVTTDSYSSLFLLWSMYRLWKFCNDDSMRNLVGLAIAIAVSQLVKQSLFHLYVIVPICIFVYVLVSGKKINWKKSGQQFLVFALINLLLINLGYYFYRSFMGLGDFHFSSHLFQSLQHSLPSKLPIPFPKPFVDGLDLAKYYDQVGGGIDTLSSFGKVTILGHSATGSGFWYYYFVSIFFKTPITYLILAAWTLLWTAKRFSYRGFFYNEFFLWMPILYFIIIMSFFYQTQCGIRHLVFIYPFIFIASGALITGIMTKAKRITLVALSVFLLVSVGRYWANYYPYTNEFIWKKKNAYRYVGAANLEFQQGYYFAERYMRNHPGVTWAPATQAPGVFIISVEDYLDIWNRKKYDWISGYKPIGEVAYNYLLIDTRTSNQHD